MKKVLFVSHINTAAYNITKNGVTLLREYEYNDGDFAALKKELHSVQYDIIIEPAIEYIEQKQFSRQVKKSNIMKVISAKLNSENSIIGHYSNINYDKIASYLYIINIIPKVEDNNFIQNIVSYAEISKQRTSVYTFSRLLHAATTKAKHQHDGTVPVITINLKIEKSFRSVITVSFNQSFLLTRRLMLSEHNKGFEQTKKEDIILKNVATTIEYIKTFFAGIDLVYDVNVFSFAPIDSGILLQNQKLSFITWSIIDIQDKYADIKTTNTINNFRALMLYFVCRGEESNVMKASSVKITNQKLQLKNTIFRLINIFSIIVSIAILFFMYVIMVSVFIDKPRMAAKYSRINTDIVVKNKEFLDGKSMFKDLKQTVNSIYITDLNDMMSIADEKILLINKVASLNAMNNSDFRIKKYQYSCKNCYAKGLIEVVIFFEIYNESGYLSALTKKYDNFQKTVRTVFGDRAKIEFPEMTYTTSITPTFFVFTNSITINTTK